MRNKEKKELSKSKRLSERKKRLRRKRKMIKKEMKVTVLSSREKKTCLKRNPIPLQLCFEQPVINTL